MYAILLGMMGSGKTTVGRRAAEMAGVSFEDTDQMLVRKLGRPVHQLFQYYGETAFRQHETKILTDLLPGSGVLATGGGIILKPENWAEMKRLGTTIFIKVPEELLIERLATAKKRRPLLETENWEDKVKELLAARMSLYLQADHVIEAPENCIDLAAERILQVMRWQRQ